MGRFATAPVGHRAVMASLRRAGERFERAIVEARPDLGSGQAR